VKIIVVDVNVKKNKNFLTEDNTMTTTKETKKETETASVPSVKLYSVKK